MLHFSTVLEAMIVATSVGAHLVDPGCAWFGFFVIVSLLYLGLLVSVEQGSERHILFSPRGGRVR
jgi:hypothetical protein